MHRPSRLWVRVSLAVIVTGLFLGALLPTAHSQVRPRLPGAPGFPGAGGIPRPGMGGPPAQRIWTCSRCSRQLATGLMPPADITCPGCNTRYINGMTRAGPGSMPPAEGGPPVELVHRETPIEIPEMPAPQPVSLETKQTNPSPGSEAKPSQPNAQPATPDTSEIEPVSPAPRKSKKLFWKLLIGAVAIAGLACLGTVAWWISSQAEPKTKPRRGR